MKRQKKNEDDKQKINFKDVVARGSDCLRFDKSRSVISFTNFSMTNRGASKPADVINPALTQFKYLSHINLSFNNISDLSLCLFNSENNAKYY